MINNANLEYILLSNYLKFTNTSRGLLLRMNFDALERIKTNTWFYKFEGENIDAETIMVKSMIQHEIIAKIMIYIEDLAIISESLLRGVSYYALLDEKETSEETSDVGDMLEKFFKNIEHLSENDFAKIMSLGDPKDYAENDDEEQLLKKALKFEKEEFLKVFKKINDFGIEHHKVFRRYKHAGFPMIPGFPTPKPLPDYLKTFEFVSFVFVNKNPLNEPRILPFSDNVIKMYGIMIAGIQSILTNVINNKISKLKQRKKRPPICWHTAFKFSLKEREKFETMLQRHNESNPPININFHINPKTTKRSKWYSNLDNLLEECEQIKKDNDEYDQSLE